MLEYNTRHNTYEQHNSGHDLCIFKITSVGSLYVRLIMLIMHSLLNMAAVITQRYRAVLLRSRDIFDYLLRLFSLAYVTSNYRIDSIIMILWFSDLVFTHNGPLRPVLLLVRGSHKILLILRSSCQDSTSQGKYERLQASFGTSLPALERPSIFICLAAVILLVLIRPWLRSARG